MVETAEHSVRTESSPHPTALPDRVRAEEQFRFKEIVRAATELDVRGIRYATGGKGDHVVELEETALGAASARPDKCAAALVTPPDLAFHSRRDGTCPRLTGAPLTRT